MKVLFRLDANQQIGAGHFERCFSIAKGILSTEQETHLTITFACISLPNKYQQRLANAGFHYINLPALINQSIDAENLISQVSHQIDILFVDHYKLAKEWETIMRPKCKRMVAIDDLANREHGEVDFLLDQTFNRLEDDYKEYVSAKTTVLSGSHYALLRDEFYSKRKTQAVLPDKFPQQIVLALGAMNNEGCTNLLVKLLLQVRKLHSLSFSLTILLSSQAYQLDELKRDIAQYPFINLLEDCDNVGLIYSTSDLAIGACGTSTWERCTLGIPSLAITLAENQIEIAEQLDRYGAHKYLGDIKNIDLFKLERTFMSFVENKHLVDEMANRALQVCDGLGVARLLRKLGLAKVHLKKATEQDIRTLYKWQSNPEIRKFSRNPKPVSWLEHLNWMKKALCDPSRHLFIIKSNTHLNSLPVGMLRLDEFLDGHEISILVDTEFQNQGIALKAINNIPDHFLLENIYASVSTANKASQKLFSNAGFKKVEDELFVLTNKKELIHEE